MEVTLFLEKIFCPKFLSRTMVAGKRAEFFSSKSCQAGVQHKKIQKAKNAAARKNSGLIDMLVFFTEPKKLNAACRAVQALLCELRAQPGIM